MITSQFPSMGFDQFWVDPPEYFDFKENNRSFESVGAYTVGASNLSAGDRPSRVTNVSVTASMFDALGVRPFRGRFIQADDNLPTTERVVVLSHELWERAFASDPAMIGKRIEITGITRTVVGIMPPGFDLHDPVSRSGSLGSPNHCARQPRQPFPVSRRSPSRRHSRRAGRAGDELPLRDTRRREPRPKTRRTASIRALQETSWRRLRTACGFQGGRRPSCC